MEGGATNIVKETVTPASKAASSNQFRFIRGHGQDHRVLQLSADSLLSIVAEVCLYYSRRGEVKSVTAARKFSGQHSRKFSAVYLGPSSLTETIAKVSLDPASIAVSC